MATRTTKKHTASLTAVDDQGNAHQLHVITTFKTFESADSPTTVPAMHNIVRDNGEAVLRLEKGKYELVTLGTILHSDDPNAP
jgi:hypothetical protein